MQISLLWSISMSKLTNTELAKILISSLSVSKKADIVYKFIKNYETDARETSELIIGGRTCEESYESDLIQTIRNNNLNNAKRAKNPEMEKSLIKMAFNALFDAIALVELERYDDVVECLQNNLLPHNRYCELVVSIYKALLDPSLILAENSKEENEFLRKVRDMGENGSCSWFMTATSIRLMIIEEAESLGLLDDLAQLIKYKDGLKATALKPKWIDYL